MIATGQHLPMSQEKISSETSTPEACVKPTCPELLERLQVLNFLKDCLCLQESFQGSCYQHSQPWRSRVPQLDSTSGELRAESRGLPGLV